MRRSALVFLLYICGFLAAISPATLHNYLQDGRFVLVTSSFGQNFYLGNHAGNQRGVYTSPEFAVASIADESDAFRKEAELRTGKTLNSGQVSTFWFKQGLIESAGMPKTALKRIYSRIRLSLGNQEVADSRTYGFYQEKFCILRPPMLGFAVISILGLAGAVSRITDRHIAALSFTVLFVVAGLSLLHVFGRFRAPLAVPLSLLAPYGIGCIMAALRKKDAMSIVLKAAFLTFLVWFTVGQVMVDKESHFVDYFNQGNHYYRQGNYELAVQEYEKAWSMKPGDHPSVIPMIMSLSDLYVSMGRMEQAAILIERAVKRYPSSRVLRSKAELFGIQPI